mmetsp:Transcript_71204/g.158278  ORF Transcript_71204/g.158278 Transcript_71204/m.158278 type:complete len:209 (-) Transcript_71204:149-775(-)
MRTCCFGISDGCCVSPLPTGFCSYQVCHVSPPSWRGGYQSGRCVACEARTTSVNGRSVRLATAPPQLRGPTVVLESIEGVVSLPRRGRRADLKARARSGHSWHVVREHELAGRMHPPPFPHQLRSPSLASKCALGTSALGECTHGGWWHIRSPHLALRLRTRRVHTGTLLQPSGVRLNSARVRGHGRLHVGARAGPAHAHVITPYRYS